MHFNLTETITEVAERVVEQLVDDLVVMSYFGDAVQCQTIVTLNIC